MPPAPRRPITDWRRTEPLSANKKSNGALPETNEKQSVPQNAHLGRCLTPALSNEKVSMNEESAKPRG